MNAEGWRVVVDESGDVSVWRKGGFSDAVTILPRLLGNERGPLGPESDAFTIRKKW